MQEDMIYVAVSEYNKLLAAFNENEELKKEIEKLEEIIQNAKDVAFEND